MNHLTMDELSKVNGAGIDEAVCITGFTALGSLGGFIFGGIATAGVGMGPGALWGASMGNQLGIAVCLS